MEFRICLSGINQRVDVIVSENLFKCLADKTRLDILMLVDAKGELCVCELTHALSLSQPKISRHLALLREQGVLSHNKIGKWVYYRISDALPHWQSQIIRTIRENNQLEWKQALIRLDNMPGRPEKALICCE